MKKGNTSRRDSPRPGPDSEAWLGLQSIGVFDRNRLRWIWGGVQQTEEGTNQVAPELIDAED